MIKWGLALGIAGAIATTTTGAHAAPNTCVPEAIGVPTKEGPPKWTANFTGSTSTTPVYPQLDDPRWQGSTAETFAYGSAKAPLQARAVWKHEGTSDYLYLSFITNINPDTTSKRDLWVGFKRATASGTQRAYVLQFHLAGATLSAPTVVPPYCGNSLNACANGPYWRAWADNGQVGGDSCDASATGTFTQFDPFNGGGDTTPPFDWLNVSGHEDITYWNSGDRWAVQVRLKVAPDSTHPITDGIEQNAKIWYAVTAELPPVGTCPGPAPGCDPRGPYAQIAQWPRPTPHALCPNLGFNDVLIHQDLGNAANWGLLSEVGGGLPPPAVACDAGLEIGAVGSIPDATITNFRGATPGNEFKAYESNGTTVVHNTLVAIAHNTSTAPITGVPLQAHFRLAGWGSAPWSVATDTGVWKPIPGTANGVCAAAPSGGAVCGPVDFAANGAAGNLDKNAVTFDYVIGADPTIGKSEYCKYGLTPAGGSCAVCSCAASATCDAPADIGTQATGVSGPTPCVSKKYQYDQCMLVELDAPNGNVGFTKQSTWNNMTFGQMSRFAREALIDARQLPAPKDGGMQDIYLLVTPRNMPRTMPGGSTGLKNIQRAALAKAQQIAQSYIDDIKLIPAGGVLSVAEKLGHGNWGGQSYGGSNYGGYGDWPIQGRLDPDLEQRVRDIAWARAIMPDDDYKKVGNLLDIVAAAPQGDQPAAQLTHDAVLAVGPSTAADLVPTLEIYPFARTSPMSSRRPTYLPMTSFTVFLSHEGPLEGITYEIDGAQKVAENIYRLRIPVGKARRILIRSQALSAGEPPQPPGSKNWPCGCCGGPNCGTLAGVSNTLPGAVAGIWLFGFRRKRKRKAA